MTAGCKEYIGSSQFIGSSLVVLQLSRRPHWSAGEGMKFGQLILSKIVKIVANKCQILRLKCTNIDFGWGSLQRSLDHLAGFKGPYF